MANEVTFSMKEAKRLGIIQETLEGRMTIETAAGILQLSERQVYRLRAQVREGGEEGIRHRLRGRTPPNALPPELGEKIRCLYEDKYSQYNFTHFTESLNEEEQIEVSRETVRRLLRSHNLGGKIRKSKKHRKRRLRKAHEGEMVFLDGSPHYWFGEAFTPCTLLLTCDDATGAPLVGLFREQEDRDGCFLVLKQLFQKHGLPQSFYLDRASQFKTTRHGGVHSLQIQEEPTQFQRAMEELGIRLIFAFSPQARGRIERMNGTFQDRLVAELSRYEITTLPEANRYLNRYFIPSIRKRFALPPRDPKPVWRAVPPALDLFDVLCVKSERTVGNDNTISYNGTIYQLKPTPTRHHFVKAKVEVRQRPDGTIRIWHPRWGRIPFQRIPSGNAS